MIFLPIEESLAPLSLSLTSPPPPRLSKKKNRFVKSFEDQPRDADRDAHRVQAFFDRADEAFRAHPAWQGATPAVLAAAGEGLEKYVLTKIHSHVFGASALDVERDEALSQRLSALSFVRPEHLEIPASHAGMEAGGSGSMNSAPAAARALALAQRELAKVNAFKAPRDKLVCVLNACRVISDSLSAVAAREAADRRQRRERVGSERRSGGSEGEANGASSSSSSQQNQQQTASTSRGADDFLPLLILVLIRASPPRLASNLEYIQRFRGSHRFHGESAYFFTQLYAAASFVETVNTSSLNVDADEFVARMASAGVPDMQLLPPPRAVVEAALADDGGREATATAAALAAAAAAPPPQHPRVEEASSAVRENPAFFLAAARETAPRELPRAEGTLQRSPFPTAEQLEKEGAELVVAADESGELASSSRFLNSAVGAEDLSIADVSELLRAYRATALRCEAMGRAADARARAWREEEGEEGEEEWEEERGRGAATATTAVAMATAEDTFVPSPPWLPSSSYAAAEDANAAAPAAAADAVAAPEAELDLSALDLSPSSSLQSLSAVPVPQPPQPSASSSSQLDVAHLLTSSSTSTTTTPRAADVVVGTVNHSGSASLI